MKNIVSLLLGDISGDGHNQRDTTVIFSNLTANEIKNAYSKGEKLLGFKFVSQVCSEYEDNSIPTELINKLVKFGFPLETYLSNGDLSNDGDDKDPEYFIWIQGYTEIYLFIVKIGNPNFEWKYTENDSCIDIGGYGLYP